MIGFLVLNLMLCYFTVITRDMRLKVLAYLILAFINGALILSIIYKIVSQKTVTLVDKVLRRNSQKQPLLEGLLENDCEIKKSELSESMIQTDYDEQNQKSELKSEIQNQDSSSNLML